MNLCVHACVLHTYIHKHKPTYKETNIHSHIRTYVHTYTRRYICICICKPSCVVVLLDESVKFMYDLFSRMISYCFVTELVKIPINLDERNI